MEFQLTFSKVRAKNFRSIGNHFIELDLNKANTTVVTANENGSGKSTALVYAITFGLFNKAYGDKQTLPSLTNSKNKKNCVVEVEFETKGHDWKVVRGLSPKKFEIYKDGTLVEAEAATKDYQAYLENVLGMNFATFTSVVCLGRDRFKPFMKMSAGERRDLVEELLGLKIFSSMMANAKADLKATINGIYGLDHKKTVLQTELTAKKELIAKLKEKLNNRNDELEVEINHLESQQKEVSQKLERANKTLEDLGERKKEFDGPVEKRNKLETACTKMETEIKFLVRERNSIQREIDRVDSIDFCPSCKQEVGEVQKHALVGTQRDQVSGILEKEQKLLTMSNKTLMALEEAKKELEGLTEINERIAKLSNVISGLVSEQTNLSRSALRLEKLKEQPSDFTDDIANAEASETEIQGNIDQLEKDLNTQYNLKSVRSEAVDMLQDNGVKASIILQYVPYLNERVRKYLQAMNFWTVIEINEKFSVEMKDVTRKGQSLYNLSSGQLTRIDLAILMAWRDVAAKMSSLSCNLLIMDEVLEALSPQGVASFMELVEAELSGINLWVVSQRRDEFAEYFQNNVHFVLQNDFTIME